MIYLLFMIIIIVIAKGFEPLTYSLEGSCSIQLSYATIVISSLYRIRTYVSNSKRVSVLMTSEEVKPLDEQTIIISSMYEIRTRVSYPKRIGVLWSKRFLGRINPLDEHTVSILTITHINFRFKAGCCSLYRIRTYVSYPKRIGVLMTSW